ncbi:putative licABCH operon regulator [Clostridium puniceum]|uniref:Putative licABCH operon regulator n=1 Tax=Clostridium puniceum TaxID=29367 RepID=A0A1S8T9A1_9CLOT|nr:BglG family transcription antiterminator [Clostridium puniceum]OOM74333.1 putative licABCH operon regulator [Clostridium puniceum]
MFIQKRLLVLFELLNKDESKISCKTLSKMTNVSERTIRGDITALNSILESYGATIKIKRNEGYYINILDLNKYQQYLAENTQELMEDNDIPNTPIERNKYILRYLLYNNNYTKLEDLADKLYISKTTILNDIKGIKSILSKYNLNLISKPYYGIKIQGSELDIRKCISENIINRDFENYILGITDEEIEIFKDIDLKKLQEIVLRDVHEFNIEFSDFSLKNFIIHLAIAISRINSGDTLTQELEMLAEDSAIKNAITPIYDEIEEYFNFNIPLNEKNYIFNHFKSKSTPKLIKANTDEKIIDYTKNLLDYIYTHYNFDLRNDTTLVSDLMLHFKSILNSKYYNLNKMNPLINTIKSNYPLAFEITLTSIENIFKKTIYNFTEDEIGYVSLHIGAAIERYFDKNINCKKIVIVCGSGYGTSRLLETRLNKVFRDKLDIIECLSYNQYLVKNLINIDLIISTIPLENKKFPVILVDFALLNKDIEGISKALTDEPIISNKVLSEYFDCNLFLKSPNVNTKEELLNLMCDTLNNNEIILPSYRESVFYRETLSSTNIDDFLAIPHPMELSAISTKICIAILKEPILWSKNTNISLVFMIAINKNDYFEMDKIYDIFLKIINNDDLKNSILNCSSYEDFLNLLQSIV